MINYDSKLVRYSAIILFLYMVWQSYDKNNSLFQKNHVQSMQFLNSPQDAKHTIDIDETKTYKDYSILEKFVYFFAKDSLPSSVRKNIEQPKYNAVPKGDKFK